MRITKYKSLITALLMVVLTGQVAASAKVFCQSQSSQPYDQLMDAGAMDHSQHMTMGADPISPDSVAATACCPDCDCSINGCAMLVLPAYQQLFSAKFVSFISSPQVSAESHIAAAVFRPPIAR